MSEITLVIDGVECKGSQGDTILQVARANDVYIPTLCFMDGLTPIGSCRMCVVEAEGSNKLLTACTSPATEGMKILTKTDRLVQYRRQILELLFAGRNHFCMFCSQSGDCELQRLAIEHGMDSVRYPFLYSDFHNDASDPNIQVDHNRCVLCLRCIRVCSEKVGAHTLDLEKRGWGTTVTSDLGKQLGKSETCVTCGACAQVCPTGTITLRDFVYRGRRTDCDNQVETLCPLCPVGCKIKAYVRTGSVVRVEGLSTASADGGQLCYKGRWWLPTSTERERLAVPMIREGSSFREASWDEALNLVAEKMAPALESGKAGALISEISTDEELAVMSSLFRDTLKMNKVDGFYGNQLRGFVEGFKPFARQGVRPFTGAQHILESDAILVLDADPQEEAPVVASYIRVSTIIGRAKLMNVSSGKNPFEGITDVDLRVSGKEMKTLLVALREGMAGGAVPENVKGVLEILKDAKKPIVVLGSNLAKTPELVTESLNLAVACGAPFEDGLGVVPMFLASNSLGALNTVTGGKDWLSEGDLDFLYVHSTGMVDEDTHSLNAMTRARFVVVQTPFMVHPLVHMADVLLPVPAWFERSGHYCTLEGERRKMNVVVPPQDNLKGLGSIMKELAAKLGHKLQETSTAPCGNVYVAKTAPDKAQIVTTKEVC